MTSRHDVHYAFCHIMLPRMVFSADGPLFLARLSGDDGSQILADLWNQLCGRNRLLRKRARDFTRNAVELTERWEAFVITPPPALEMAEAHFVGLLIDFEVLNEATAQGSDAVARSGGVRYLCLERSHPMPTMIGEWHYQFGERSNLGFGPDPSVEAMVQVLAGLVGITVAFDDEPEPKQAPSHAVTSAPSEEDPLDLVDHLERLQRLHADGFLSEEEVAAAKAKFLD